MNLGEQISQSQREEEQLFDKNMAKMGNYTGDDCPNCGRQRVMICDDDEKRRCEKCSWCVEDKDYDYEFLSFMTGNI